MAVWTKEYRRNREKTWDKQFPIDEEFLRKWSGDLAYLLGFMAGDGHVSRKSNHIYIESTDKEVVEKAKEWLRSKHKLRTVKRDKWKDEYLVEMGRKKIHRIFAKFELKNPSVWKKIPKEYFWDFVRGFHDAEASPRFIYDKRWGGHLYLHVSFSQKSKEYLESLRKSLISRGVRASLVCPTNNGCHYFEISHTAALKMSKFMYNGGFCLRRKRERYETFK